MKIFRIDNLGDGQWAQSANIPEILRNIQVIRVNDSSVLVNAEKREGPDSPWERVREYIAGSVQVIPCDGPIKEINESGQIIEKKVRASKVNIPIVWPEKFDMKELVKNNPAYSQPSLYIMVQKEIKEGKVKVFDRVKSESGRGKPTCIYQLIKE